MLTKSPNLQSALIRLLRPLVRLLLKNGVAYNDFVLLVRSVYVEIAHKEMAKPGRKQSLSNVSVMTGIHRHEVKRLLAEPSHQVEQNLQFNRAARVISGWTGDADFSDDGKPRDLLMDSEFKELIKRYSGDITPRAILDELLRIGVVCRKDKNTLSLVVPAYVPQVSDDELVQIFGDSVADLITTLEYNLSTDMENRRFQMTAIYDNFPDEALQDVELMISEKSLKFLTDLDRFLKTQDRDSNPNLEGSGRNRAGVGIYFFKEPVNEKQRS